MSGLCSGLRRSCGPCGAYLGGLVALGLAYGRDSGDEPIDPVYARAREFREWFVETFGDLGCHELTGLDFGDPADAERFRRENRAQAQCRDYVVLSADFIARMVERDDMAPTDPE
jgi:hypothetical protein